MMYRFRFRSLPFWLSRFALLLWASATLGQSQSQVPTLLDPGFSTGQGVSDDVFSIARVSNGQYLIAGQFATYDGTPRGRLARIDSGGTLDPSFFGGAGAENSIYTVAIQADGKVLIGGAFTTVHSQAKPYLARLETNGELDNSFASGITINNELRAIIVEPDGKILIAGRFTQVWGQSRNRLARLNADGSLDATFNPGTGANDNIRTMLRLADGRLLIGGLFTNYNGASRGRIARLMSNGTLDPSFDPGLGANEQVRAIATNSAGQIYIGGDFEQYNGTNRSSVARLFSNGGLDLAFDPGDSENDAVRALAVQPDGKVWIGGIFYQAGGLFRSNIARLNTDGSADDFFDPFCSMNDEVFALDYDGANRLLVGGKFTRVDNRLARRLAMLSPQSQSMLFVFDQSVVGVQENSGPARVGIRRLGAFTLPGSVGMTTRSGTAIAGEDFQLFSGNIQFNSNQRTGVAQVVVIDDPFPDGNEWFEAQLVNPPGMPAGATNEILQFPIVDNEYQVAVEESFKPDFVNGPVYATALQTDGKVVIGGAFTYRGGCLENYFSRLNADGTVDCNFYIHSTGIDGPVHSIAVQPNGAIIAAGAFIYFNSQPAHYLARVQTNGLTDPTFSAGTQLNGKVLAVALQPDGRILIGGMFTAYGSTPLTYLTRLNSDGSLDPSFTAVLNTNGYVRAIRLTTGGRFLIAGDFTEVNGVPRSRLARLNANGLVDANFVPVPGPNGSILDIAEQPDGRVVLAGEFSAVDQQPRPRLARLQTSGALDPTFNAGTFETGTRVNSVDIQADGRIVFGGFFTRIGSAYRPFIARAHPNGTLDTGFFPSSANGELHRIRVLPDGHLLAAGSFTEIGGVSRLYVARLNPESGLIRIEQVVAAISFTENFGASVSVRRAGVSTTTVSVHFETVAETAQAGSDFIAQSGTLSFAPLETHKIIPLSIVNDGLPEGPEQFRVILSNPAGAVLGSPSESIVRILDNDAGIGLTDSEVFLREGASEVTLVIHRNSDGPESISVDFATIDGTARDGSDYQATNGTLTFLPGEMTKSVTILLSHNSAFEGRESFRFVLSNPSSGAGLGAKSETTVFIDDQDSSFEFGTTYSAGNESSGAALCYLVRRGFATISATVRVRSDGGTATPGLDYLPVDRVFTFAPGELYKDFYVTNLNDGLVEPTETIRLTLSEPTGLSVVVNPAETNLLIFDNDLGIDFSAPAFYVNEFSSHAEVSVRRGDDGTEPLTVQYRTTNELAVAGVDYLASSGTLTLPPATIGSVSTVSFLIPILQDKTLETNEPFRVILTQPGPMATLGTQAVARVVIVDDELAGSLDLTFRVNPADISPFGNADIRLARHSEQKLLVSAPSRFLRLLPDGRTDPTFDASALFYYFWPPTALQRPDGRILVGGSSSNGFGSSGSLCLRLLESSGTNVESFSFPIVDGRTAVIALQTDGRILVGGSYNMWPDLPEFRSVLRVRSNGSLDPTFEAGEFLPATGYYSRPSTVEALALQPDGKILAAGMFVTVQNQPRPKIVRLNSNGSLDPTFAGPSVSGISIFGPSAYDSHFASIALQPDGRIIVGGTFTNIGGQTAYNLARYLPDGALDSSFAPNLAVDQIVTAVALQPDGKVLVSGGAYNYATGTSQAFIYRLLANGDRDPYFNPGGAPNDAITSMVLLDGGDIAIGGEFREVNGIPARLVARLKGDGLFLRARPSTPNTVLLELFNTWPGGTTVMEASGDLLSWLPIQTNVAASAHQEWIQPTGGERLFFRARHTSP